MKYLLFGLPAVIAYVVDKDLDIVSNQIQRKQAVIYSYPDLVSPDKVLQDLEGWDASHPITEDEYEYIRKQLFTEVYVLNECDFNHSYSSMRVISYNRTFEGCVDAAFDYAKEQGDSFRLTPTLVNQLRTIKQTQCTDDLLNESELYISVEEVKA